CELRGWSPLSACRSRPLLPTGGYPHFRLGISSVGGEVNHGVMFFDALAPEPASGDRHPMLVETVRTGGPHALTAMLGDGAFTLRELALRPQHVFAADADLASAHKGVVGMIHELRSAMDALEARAVTALAESLTLQEQAEVRGRDAHEQTEVPPARRLLREAAIAATRDVPM